MAKISIQDAIAAAEFLDKEYGLLLGDLNHNELQNVLDVIEKLMSLDERALNKVNIEFLRRGFK